ncbi:hypothetical protein [Hubei picorna-like virus 37]|uniref:hypothetical protein n=1 Tax=Hubei picorna-like virus 37 TaxID=1923117 RepID=UPI00090B7F9E|nr:hypothetical protein [Hubei picorna-like virus 37]APG78429.1 hypothetical protein [Hubei picorna-like virus 37]
MSNNNVSNNNIDSTRFGGNRARITFGSIKLSPSNPNRTIQATESCNPNNERCQKFISSFFSTFVQNAKIIPFDNFEYNQFDSWFNNLHLPFQEFTLIRRSGAAKGVSSRYRMVLSPGGSSRRICLTSTIEGSKPRQAWNLLCQLFDVLTRVEYQADSEVAKPVETKSEVDSAGMTEIATADGSDEGISVMPDPEILKDLSNTEMTFEFPSATDNYRLLEQFKIDTNKARNSLNKVYKLPGALFTQRPNGVQCASNTMPFQNFAYSDCDIEFKILCNGARMATGMLIAASYPDPYDGFGELSCDCFSMVQRSDHIKISMSKNNEGTITIQNNYRRTFARNYAADNANKGVSTQQFSALQLEIWSPYTVAAGQPTTCQIQVMYRFKRCTFAAAAYGLEINQQAPPIENQLVTLATTLMPAVKPVERLLKRTGIISNQDKPYGGPTTRIIPQPRLNFSAGVGISDSIPLTLDHSTTVTQLREHLKPTDPKTMLEIARIPGVERVFTWQTSDASGANLLSWPIFPTACFVSDSKIDTVPTPLKYVTSCYQMWRGTIKAKLLVVSNDFHTGTLQVEASFNRIPSDVCGLSSTYTKTFQLGEIKEFEFDIPYIYDTPWRRTNRQVDDAILRTDYTNGADDPKNWSRIGAATVISGYPTALAERTKAYLHVTVVNPLNPIAQAPSKVEVFLFLSAGKDYNLHSLMPSQFHTAYRDEDFNVTPWFGRFPNMGFMRDDSRSDDPIYYISSVTSHSTDKTESLLPTMSDMNGYAVRADEGLAKVTEGVDKTKKKVYFQGPLGPARMMFHTTDSQHRIKDIMRRSIKVYSGATLPLKGSTKVDGVEGDCIQSFWFPCHVPNHFDGLHPLSRAQVSPHAAIASLFRHWRGSMRWSIFFHSNTSVPIYVSYVPNTGVRYLGPHRQIYQINKLNETAVEGSQGHFRQPLMLCETGLATEPVICSVNPSCSISSVFDVVNNRNVVSKRLRTQSNVKLLMGREEISDIAGHIVIQTEAPVTNFDIFWSIGDDFELSSFVGCPRYKQYVAPPHGDDFQVLAPKVGRNNVNKYELADIRGLSTRPGLTGSTVSNRTETVHAGFRHERASSRVKRETTPTVEYQMEKALLATGAATTIGIGSIIGTKCVSSVNEISRSSQLFLSKAGVTIDKIHDIAHQVGISVSHLMESLTSAFENAKKSIGSVFSWGESTYSFLVNFFIDLFLLIKDFSPLNLALHTVKLINQLFPAATTFVMSKVETLKNIIASYLGTGPAQQQSGPGSESTAGESLLGVFVFLLGSALNIKYDTSKKFVDLKSATLNRFTSVQGLLYFPAALSFAKHLFSTIKSALSWLYNNTTDNYGTMLANHSKEISDFVQDVDLITNPLNLKLIQTPDMRTKLWSCYVRASQLSAQIVKMKDSRGAVHLTRYIDRLRKFAEERSVLGTCCPVRREPLVLCIEGPSNIGKSFISHQILLELLREAGAPIEGNPIYTRTPGLAHWDGYSGQPAIVYDDWMNLAEPKSATDQLAELFMLKSTSDCILPMANLSEKGLKANPYLVMLLTNNAFPCSVVNSIAQTEEAVFRRRDFLIKARKTRTYECTPTREIPKEILEKFEHLEFSYSDPQNKEVINDAATWMNYPTFLEDLKKKSNAYMENERQNVQGRLNKLKEFSSQTTLLDDPTEVLNFGLFYNELSKLAEESGNASQYLSDRLEEALKLVTQRKVLHQAPPTPEPLPSIPEDQEPQPSTSTAGLPPASPPCPDGLEHRPGFIGQMLRRFPLLSSFFERTGVPHFHNVTTKGETMGGEFGDDYCSHCKQSKYIYFGPSTHLVCADCKAFDDSTRHGNTRVLPSMACALCEAPSIFSRVSYHTLSLLNKGIEGVKNFKIYAQNTWNKMHTVEKALLIYFVCIFGMSAGLVALCPPPEDYMPMYSSKQMEQIVSMMQSQGKGPFFQISPEWRFNESAFEEIMLQRGVRVTRECHHKDVFCVSDPAVEYYHPACDTVGFDQSEDVGFWKDENDESLSLSPCGDDCWLLTDIGKAKYLQFAAHYHEYTTQIYQAKFERLTAQSLATREIINFSAYIPPFSLPKGHRDRYLKLRTQPKKSYPWLRNFIQSLKDKIPQSVQTIMKYLALGCTVVGLLAGAYQLTNWISGTSEQIMSSGSYQVRHFLKNKATIKTSTIKPPTAKPQSDEVLQESLRNKIQVNSMNVIILKDNMTIQSLGYTGIMNRVAIMPKHYLKAIRKYHEEGCTFKLKSARFNTSADYKFSESDFIEGESDIAIFMNPKTVHCFANIVKFMAKESDHQTPLTNKGYMLKCKTLRSDFLTVQSLTFKGITPSLEVNGEGGVTEGAVDSLTYDFSQAGACGSLVMRYNHTRPILAMHFAGTSSANPIARGYGVLLTQETFADVLNLNQALSEEEKELKPAHAARNLLPEFVEVQSLGALEQKVHIPTKTKILPSKIQALLPPPETLPGYLTKHEPGYKHELSPLVAGCAKHGQLTQNFSTDEIDEVANALWTLKYMSLEPVVESPKKLSVKEAIVGFQIPGYTPLHLNTSMGYDWVFSSQTQKKSYIVVDRNTEGEVTSVQIHKRLYEELARVEALRKNNIIPFLPYVDELKDERRALAKREKLGSTRVFCMASVLSSIPNRQNFLHFAAAYTNARIHRLNHAVGISTDGPEWGDLAHHLLSLSNNIVTLDYSNFGPGYNAMVNAAGHDIIQNWTKLNVEGVDDNEMTVLGEEHYNSLHVMGDLVYRQLSGGPSGDPLTVVKNGLVNELYMLLAWKHLMSEYCLNNCLSLYESFFNLTRLIVYGDDLIMSVAEEIKELFNGVTIKQFFAKYGITATDALKSGADIPYTTINEASFLKCGFVPHPSRDNQWLAPLEKRSIFETAKWIHSSPNEDEATRQVVEASILNAFGHGKEFYESWRSELNQALAKVNIDPVFRTWEEVDKTFFE